MRSFFECREFTESHFCRMRPESSSRKSSTRGACLSARANNVVLTSSDVNGNACKLVRMLSRPNIVMNHGSPAAGSARFGFVRVVNLSAAKSTRLRLYVALRLSEGTVSGRVPAIQVFSLPAMSAVSRSETCVAELTPPGATDEPTNGTTSNDVFHSPCESIFP